MSTVVGFSARSIREAPATLAGICGIAVAGGGFIHPMNFDIRGGINSQELTGVTPSDDLEGTGVGNNSRALSSTTSKAIVRTSKQFYLAIVLGSKEKPHRARQSPLASIIKSRSRSLLWYWKKTFRLKKRSESRLP